EGPGRGRLKPPGGVSTPGGGSGTLLTQSSRPCRSAFAEERGGRQVERGQQEREDDGGERTEEREDDGCEIEGGPGVKPRSIARRSASLTLGSMSRRPVRA